MKPLDVKAKLRAWLEAGRPITPQQALRLWGCFRLASYIHRLKSEKMAIETKIVFENGVQFARYRLTK
jgi:hypothetical protein